MAAIAKNPTPLSDAPPAGAWPAGEPVRLLDPDGVFHAAGDLPLDPGSAGVRALYRDMALARRLDSAA